MTEALFRSEPYARECEARVTAINDRGAIALDRTIFYASGGGQPGDAGALEFAGTSCPIATTVYDEDRKTILHVPADAATPPAVGDTVKAVLNWDQRYKYMRVPHRPPSPLQCHQVPRHRWSNRCR